MAEDKEIRIKYPETTHLREEESEFNDSLITLMFSYI